MSQQIIISAEGFGTTLVLNMGSDKPALTDGVAKWNEVERPRRRAVLEYNGESLLKLSFSVMLDAHPDGDVEDRCRQIYGLAARSGLNEPTKLRLSGPIPYTELRYVLTGIEEKEEVLQRRPDGRRSRSELKLTMTEYQQAELIVQGIQAAASPASPAKAVQTGSQFSASDISENPKLAIAYGVAYTGGAAAQRTYTVKKGDTLSGIAAKQLGNANRWQEIANLAGIRDPRKLQIGTVLKLP